MKFRITRVGFTLIDSLIGFLIISSAVFLYLGTNHLEHQRLKNSQVQMEKARNKYEDKIQRENK